MELVEGDHKHRHRSAALGRSWAPFAWQSPGETHPAEKGDPGHPWKSQPWSSVLVRATMDPAALQPRPCCDQALRECLHSMPWTLRVLRVLPSPVSHVAHLQLIVSSTCGWEAGTELWVAPRRDPFPAGPGFCSGKGETLPWREWSPLLTPAAPWWLCAPSAGDPLPSGSQGGAPAPSGVSRQSCAPSSAKALPRSPRLVPAWKLPIPSFSPQAGSAGRGLCWPRRSQRPTSKNSRRTIVTWGPGLGGWG